MMKESSQSLVIQARQLRQGFSGFIFWLFSLVFICELASQEYTFPEIKEIFLRERSQTGDLILREACFGSIDDLILSTYPPLNPDTRGFYTFMIDKAIQEIKTENVTEGATIWQIYNHGFVVVTPSKAFGFDLKDRYNTIKDFLDLADILDACFISHEHSDHYTSSLLYAMNDLNKPVVGSAEWNNPAVSVKMDSGDTLIIAGLTVIAHYGDHTAPVRQFEVHTPEGLKIVHTGDNTSLEHIPDVENLDVILFNCWGSGYGINGIKNVINKAKPKVLLPGHMMELGHLNSTSSPVPYRVVIPSASDEFDAEYHILAWGERYHYNDDSSDSVRPNVVENPIYSILTDTITFSWELPQTASDGDTASFYRLIINDTTDFFTINKEYHYTDFTSELGNVKVYSYDDCGNQSITYAEIQGLENIVYITFKVTVPDFTPFDDVIFMTGTFNQWDPGPGQTGVDDMDHDIFMTSVGGNQWQITLPFNVGETIEYLYTRGSWDNVEKGIQGEDIPNHILTVLSENDTQEDNVATWADIQSAVEEFKAYLQPDGTIKEIPYSGSYDQDISENNDIVEWKFPLTGDILGDSFELNVIGGSQEISGTTFYAELLLKTSLGETSLATTSFFGPCYYDPITYDITPQQMNVELTGIDPTAQAGDTLLLQVKVITGAAGRIIYGTQVGTNYLKIPYLFYPLSAPELYSPANGSKNISSIPHVTWLVSNGASSYFLQVSKNTDFLSNVFSDSMLVKTSQLIGSLESETDYYWRVRAKNSAGFSPWSDTWCFSTSALLLVAHWKFDETTGLIACDELGISSGTLVNMSGDEWVGGHAGNAINFQAGNIASHILVPDNEIIDFQGSTSFTISCLVKTDPISISDEIRIVTKGSGSVDPAMGREGKWYALAFKNQEIRFYVDDNISKTQLAVPINSTSYPVNQWAHLVGVRDVDEDSMKIYLNGILVGSMEDITDGDISSGELPLIIGNNDIPNMNFRGQIDDLRMYNCALSEDEVQFLFDSYAGVTAGYSASPTSGTVPLTVQFSDSSAGSIKSWFWDFGDGNTSTEQNPSHTYETADTFTVSLTVTGPGGSDTETKEKYIIMTNPVSVMDNEKVLPTSFAVYQNYPNPFNPNTQIEYDVQEPFKVYMVIYNLNGQVVKELVNSYQQPGKYFINVNMQEIPSGIYFYEIQIGDFQAIKKMVKIE